jgi:hypothetical protein
MAMMAMTTNNSISVKPASDGEAGRKVRVFIFNRFVGFVLMGLKVSK